jgi:hypothetical protein
MLAAGPGKVEDPQLQAKDGRPALMMMLKQERKERIL